MMQTLYSLKGAEFRIGILAKPEVQEFIEAHAGVLDSGFSRVEMSEAMRRRLTRSDYIFSGMKTFHELNEAFPSLLDENGNRKPFEQFLNDVRKIDSTYNGNYLRAEYNFVQSSAQMAARWEQFTGDGDRYNLQYRTAADGKVRPTHAALHGVTLPITDPFWEEYYPPNGWNCRCTVVQVRKSKYPETPHDEAMALGEEALQKDSKGIFHFNAGKERKSMPDYNPYTIRRCRDCDVPKGKLKLVFVPDNELCAACEILHKCAGDREKTQRAIERTHYLHGMKPLLKKSETLNANGTDIRVGFSAYGNKHLFSDTFGRSSILRKDDLASLDEVLKGAEFMDDAALTHPRTDGIEHFYYFKAQIRGQWVRLNVAKEVKHRPNGFVRVSYYLYSINDI
ncbi:phage head morphogenesis protein [Bacteroides fragilis]|uniref:Minor capsid protein n=2 Tax=Bacteroides fragilis TaxID=817 RepID=A0AAP9SYU9_BACFG|nr:phage minor head protein [Bacteroides fragilis]EFR54615.1 phage protein F-like protein [Bacteroides fragilis 3_1_12]MBM6512214.1 minor capsid protein [Bacteroides fragilis]QKH87404.1 minor capsid protein [Bacteroides fragilis]